MFSKRLSLFYVYIISTRMLAEYSIILRSEAACFSVRIANQKLRNMNNMISDVFKCDMNIVTFYYVKWIRSTYASVLYSRHYMYARNFWKNTLCSFIDRIFYFNRLIKNTYILIIILCTDDSAFVWSEKFEVSGHVAVYSKENVLPKLFAYFEYLPRMTYYRNKPTA